ncbi:MAG: hypothetical protein ABFD89_23870 [Bryobacteraceae bacterium]
MVIINKDTGISITLVAAIITGIISVVGILYSIDRRLMAIEYQSADPWTGQMQVIFARDLEAANRGLGLKVPDCDEIQEDLARRMKLSQSAWGCGGAWAAEPMEKKEVQ